MPELDYKQEKRNCDCNINTAFRIASFQEGPELVSSIAWYIVGTVISNLQIHFVSWKGCCFWGNTNAANRIDNEKGIDGECSCESPNLFRRLPRSYNSPTLWGEYKTVCRMLHSPSQSIYQHVDFEVNLLLLQHRSS